MQGDGVAKSVQHIVVFVQKNHTTDNYFRSMRAWGANVADDWPRTPNPPARNVGAPRHLRLDRTRPATYPNGRVLTDDVYSMRFAWLTHGKVPPTGLKPHDNLLGQFPYLGMPNSTTGQDLIRFARPASDRPRR